MWWTRSGTLERGWVCVCVWCVCVVVLCGVLCALTVMFRWVCLLLLTIQIRFDELMTTVHLSPLRYFLLIFVSLVGVKYEWLTYFFHYQVGFSSMWRLQAIRGVLESVNRSVSAQEKLFGLGPHYGAGECVYVVCLCFIWLNVDFQCDEKGFLFDIVLNESKGIFLLSLFRNFDWLYHHNGSQARLSALPLTATLNTVWLSLLLATLTSPLPRRRGSLLTCSQTLSSGTQSLPPKTTNAPCLLWRILTPGAMQGCGMRHIILGWNTTLMICLCEQWCGLRRCDVTHGNEVNSICC